MYTVYVHINKVNGKRYVGLTKNKPYKRWKGGNGYRLVKGNFYSDIQKYGWDKFEHKIIAEGLEYYEAITLERRLVRGWKTNDPRYGYNVTQGGRSGAHGGKNGMSKPVIMITDDGEVEFKCAADAARHVNGNRSNIISACKGRIKTAYGFRWRYKDG